MHAAAEQNGLPVSTVTGSANVHDSTKLTGVMEDISNCLDDIMMEEIVTVYADKGYDYTIHQKLLPDAMALEL